ncbi:MAG: hydroxyacid dehydrogenase [Candidatus Didemnitutus sp.]|nr:hydroxyacid dehydrogenase [Candidatus Didemnitutus sp.]
MNGIIIADLTHLNVVYPPATLARLQQTVTLVAPPQTAKAIRQNLHLLRDVEVIFSGWGGPVLDAELLQHAPKLRAVLYAAGTVKGIVTDEFWSRGIALSAAPAANAIPVAEFTLSQILFGLKLGWQHNQLCKRGDFTQLVVPGGLGSTVGLISMGHIAKLVRRLLAAHEVKVITCDPFLTAAEAVALDIERVALPELFERSAVVSLHTPELPETNGMIRREHFERLPRHATFINTARSAVVCHDDLIAVWQQRPDLWAVLDVTECATPGQRKALQDLENITLTPHIAGSRDGECRRMGDLMADELERLVAGRPLQHAVTRAQMQMIA